MIFKLEVYKTGVYKRDACTYKIDVNPGMSYHQLKLRNVYSKSKVHDYNVLKEHVLDLIKESLYVILIMHTTLNMNTSSSS